MNVEQFSDALSWTHGRHNIKAGVSFLRENIYRNAARISRGSASFNGSFTQDPNTRGNTGNGLADFLLGTASSATIGNEAGENAVQHNYSAYIQDDWHLIRTHRHGRHGILRRGAGHAGKDDFAPVVDRGDELRTPKTCGLGLRAPVP